MPRPLEQASFDPSRPVIVCKAINTNGRRLRPGDLFNWRRYAVGQRRVRQLFDMGKLRHQGHNEEAPIEEADLAIDVVAPAADPAEPLPKTLFDPSDIDPAPEGDELDELEAIDSMNDLRDIAEREGADLAVSKVKQREAIRANRAATSAVD